MKSLQASSWTKTLAAVAMSAFTFALSAGVALANNAGGTPDELGIGAHVNNFVGVLQGPFVKLVAVVLVLVGVFLMSRGDEMHQGLRTIGGVAIGFALLLALPTILNLVGVNQVTGSLLPLTAHFAR